MEPKPETQQKSTQETQKVTGGKGTIVLFDIDNTLAIPMQNVDQEMTDLLLKLQAKGITIGSVGGSDFTKCSRQLGPKRKKTSDSHTFSS